MNEVIAGQRRAASLARPQRRSAEGVGWLVVVAGVALGSVRFVGEGAAMRSMTSLLAAVAFGAVVSAPGVAVVVGVRWAAPALLVAAALALAPLSLLSPVTLPLLVIAIVLVVAWARRPQVGPRGRAAASAIALPVATTCAAAILVVVTTERTVAARGAVHSTDGWVTAPTSAIALAVTALGTVASCWLAPRASGDQSD